MIINLLYSLSKYLYIQGLGQIIHFNLESSLDENNTNEIQSLAHYS